MSDKSMKELVRDLLLAQEVRRETTDSVLLQYAIATAESWLRDHGEALARSWLTMEEELTRCRSDRDAYMDRLEQIGEQITEHLAAVGRPFVEEHWGEALGELPGELERMRALAAERDALRNACQDAHEALRAAWPVIGTWSKEAAERCAAVLDESKPKGERPC